MVRGWFLGIVPIAGKALQMQKKLKIFFLEGTNLVDEIRLFCYNSSLRGYDRESLAAQTHGGARRWKNTWSKAESWASSRGARAGSDSGRRRRPGAYRAAGSCLPGGGREGHTHCVHEGARARLRDFGRRCLRGVCPLSAFLLVPTEYFRIFPGYYNIAGNSNILRKEEHYAYF